MSEHKRRFTESYNEPSDLQPVAKRPPPPLLNRPPPPPRMVPPPPRLGLAGLPRPPPPRTAPPLSRPPTSNPLAKSITPTNNSSDDDESETVKKPIQKPKGGFGIAIKIGSTSSKSSPIVGATSQQVTKKPQPKKSVASVFNVDSSDEEEEMPVEAKMRMRNVGRETITSSGPNSFGKTKQGFTDANKLFERKLKEDMDRVSNDT